MPAVPQPQALLGAGEFSFSDGDEEPFPFVMLPCPETAGGEQLHSAMWSRYRGTAPADDVLQQQLLAYLSDATILQPALQAHQLQWDEPGLMVMTMNHSIWFHRPLAIDDWCLMYSESPSAGNGRAFATANLFDSAGALAATFAQEAVLRLRRD